MNSLRVVKDDLLKNQLYFRDENFCSLVNEITEIGAESFQYKYKDLQFCQYQIPELIRDNLHEILGQNNELPSEYKKIINTTQKEGK